MSTLSTPGPATVVVPAPRAALPCIPAPREPVDRTDRRPTPPPATRSGRHRAVSPGHGRTATSVDLVTLAARIGSVVTLAAMLVLAAAVAGTTDGDVPTGDAAVVASTTLP